jgi:hypothetical protein
MKSVIRIFIQEYNKIAASNRMSLQADWDLERKLQREYETELSGEDAANQAFKVFNKENLTKKEKDILGNYNAPSLSVGDIVEVHPVNPDLDGTSFLCAPIGWKCKTIPNLHKNKDKNTEDINEPTVNFGNEQCKVFVSLYKDSENSENPTPALQLLAEDGSPMATATINLQDFQLKKDHILVKNYSENSGVSIGKKSKDMVQALEEGNIATPIQNFKLGPFNSEVTLMKITSPWILKQIEEKTKDIPKQTSNLKRKKFNEEGPDFL